MYFRCAVSQLKVSLVKIGVLTETLTVGSNGNVSKELNIPVTNVLGVWISGHSATTSNAHINPFLVDNVLIVVNNHSANQIVDVKLCYAYTN